MQVDTGSHTGTQESGNRQAFFTFVVNKKQKEAIIEKSEKLVIVGCEGVGGPAAMLAMKLMPDPEMSSQIQTYLEEKGIKMLMGKQIEKILKIDISQLYLAG